MAPSKLETGLPIYHSAPQWWRAPNTGKLDEFGTFAGVGWVPEPTDNIYEKAFDRGPRHINSLIPVRLETTAAVPRSSELSTDMLAFVVSAKIAEMHEALSGEIANLQSAFGAIAGTVEMLAVDYSARTHPAGLYQASHPERETNPDARELLNSIADRGTPDATLKDLAIESLRSEIPSVRSAGARALAVIDPTQALELLPGVLALEGSKVAKRVIASALRSAAL